MSAQHLHPDHLMERASHELSEAERRLLQAHLRQCVACRLERAARADFERDIAHVSSEHARQIVARLLPPVPLHPRPHRAARVTGTAAAGLLALAGGLAAAATWHTPPPAPLIATLRAPASGAAAPTVAPPGPGPKVAEAPAVPDDPPVVVFVTREVPDAAGPRTSARPPARAEIEPLNPVLRTEGDAGAPAAPSAASMFEEATSARRAAEYARAAVLYGALLGAFPASAESQTARAVFGRMALDRGDSARALFLFDEYLQRGGVLAEDALLGKAIALERLGETSDARAAWSSLLRMYPDSVQAPRALARLRALAGME